MAITYGYIKFDDATIPSKFNHEIRLNSPAFSIDGVMLPSYCQFQGYDGHGSDHVVRVATSGVQVQAGIEAVLKVAEQHGVKPVGVFYSDAEYNAYRAQQNEEARRRLPWHKADA